MYSLLSLFFYTIFIICCLSVKKMNPHSTLCSETLLYFPQFCFIIIFLLLLLVSFDFVVLLLNRWFTISLRGHSPTNGHNAHSHVCKQIVTLQLLLLFFYYYQHHHQYFKTLLLIGVVVAVFHYDVNWEANNAGGSLLRE